MSRLPLTDAHTLEKVLLQIGFQIKRKKEAMFFTGIPIADKQQFHITKAGFLAVHYYVIYLGKQG